MQSLPRIDAVGIYEVKEPFVVESGAIYVCEALESFEALERRGVDIYESYYAPHGLSLEICTADRNTEAKIVTLISTTGHPDLVLPSSYILSFPAHTGGLYSRLIMSIGLGLVADNLEMESAKTHIAEYLSDLLGIEAEVQLHRLPLSGPLDAETVTRLETARAGKRTFRKSSANELQYWINRCTAAETRIEMLEEALVNLSNTTP